MTTQRLQLDYLTEENVIIRKTRAGVKTSDQVFAMYLFFNNAPLRYARELSQRFADGLPRGVTDVCDKNRILLDHASL